MFFSLSPNCHCNSVLDCMEQFVDTATVADFLGLVSLTVAKMAREGRIPAHAVSGARRRTWRFDLAEVKNSVTLPGRPGVPADEREQIKCSRYGHAEKISIGFSGT